MSKANMSIDMIFIISVSIIGIFFLLFMFSGKFPALGKDIYCNTFFHLQSSRFFPEPMRTAQDYCETDTSKKIKITPLALRTFKTTGLSGGATTLRITQSATATIDIPEEAIPISSTFEFFTRDPISTLAIDVDSDLSPEVLMTSFPDERFSVNIPADAIYRVLNNTPKPCLNGRCQISIGIGVIGGNVVLTSAQIEYKSCSALDTVIAQMVLCDEQSESGNLRKDLACGEISVFPNCNPVNATEFQAVQRIKEQNLCSILSKESMACGYGERVNWQINQIVPGQNILVAYSYREKQIKVI